MRLYLLLALTALLGASPLPAAGSDPPPEQRLVVSETEDLFRLSLPVSRLTMTIPRKHFTVVHDPGTGATANSRYFHLEDAAQGIIITGWFEPANSYPGIEQFWKGETAAWKKNKVPMPLNESFQKTDKWDLVLYDNKLPGGSNTHIRGEWVESGTWIDVHISVTTDTPIEAARATCMDVLRGIRIVSAP